MRERLDLDRMAATATRTMLRENSRSALWSAVELMLTDRSVDEVLAELRALHDYLEERK